MTEGDPTVTWLGSDEERTEFMAAVREEVGHVQRQLKRFPGSRSTASPPTLWDEICHLLPEQAVADLTLCLAFVQLQFGLQRAAVDDGQRAKRARYKAGRKFNEMEKILLQMSAMTTEPDPHLVERSAHQLARYLICDSAFKSHQERLGEMRGVQASPGTYPKFLHNWVCGRLGALFKRHTGQYRDALVGLILYAVEFEKGAFSDFKSGLLAGKLKERVKKRRQIAGRAGG